ncbi:hypothetical protein ACGFY6_32985 [Streptomyces sp. NPDC048387]|uniref:hypothetical protein n=1 Tax=Streptomyces sp. NPDC048387 TaxID=3365542 RepID=UPI003721989B
MVASVEVPIVDGMDFTVGVDSATSSARNAAATGNPSPIPGGTGSIISFHMEQVETVEDLMDALGISAKANGGIGLFSASARFNFAESCKVHSSSVFLIVSVQVTEAFQSIRQPGIDPSAAALLANGQTERFKDEFGDLFVRGIRNGGQFFGVIEVLTRDETDAKAISAGLAASFSAFSGSGTFDTTFTHTVNSHRTNVTCHIEGGQKLELPTQIDTMTRRAVNFPGELAGHAVPYLALLNDYGVLPLPQPPNFIDLQHQKDVLIECARLRNLHQQWMNDLDYIGGHLDQFVDPDPARLSQLRNDISRDLNLIAAAASHAINKPKEAQLPTGLHVAVPQFPARRIGSAITIAATAHSLEHFPTALRDVPDNFEATTDLTVLFPESSISTVRFAGFGVLNPVDNHYTGMCKFINAFGSRIGSIDGIVGQNPHIDAGVPFASDTVSMKLRVAGSSVFMEGRSKGPGPSIQSFSGGSGPASSQPSKLIFFAVSEDDISFVAGFSEPKIVPLPP